MGDVFYFASCLKPQLTISKYEALYMEHINLRHELDQLKRLVFGSRHERFVPSTPQEQLALGLEAARSSSPDDFTGTGPNH